MVVQRQMGRVGLAEPTSPYTTRLLVRYPTNPAKFNGTVVFEWLNDTTGGDQDPVWAQLYNELINKGYAYVGVTAQRPGMKDLATWDPKRYGKLGDSNDGESYEIFTQAAEVVKADSATLLGGLTPKELIGTGDSQSAFRVDTYVNAIQPLTHAFNGFLAVGRGVTAAPIGEGLVAASPFPALIRTDNTAPFIQLNTQGDIEELDAAAARQPDNNYLRTWEVAGRLAHRRPRGGVRDRDDRARGADRGSALVRVRHADRGHRDGARRSQPDRQHAAVRGRGRRDGGPAELGGQRRRRRRTARRSRRSPCSSAPYYLVNKNKYGIGEGGIRMPDAQVPMEDYSAINFANVSEESLSPLSILSRAGRRVHHARDRRHQQRSAARRGSVPAVRVLHRFQQLQAEIAVPHDRRAMRRSSPRRRTPRWPPGS